jgi:hypothetical protein
MLFVRAMQTVVEYLRGISSDVTLVQGDFDEAPAPEQAVMEANVGDRTWTCLLLHCVPAPSTQMPPQTCIFECACRPLSHDQGRASGVWKGSQHMPRAQTSHLSDAVLVPGE